MWKKEQNKKRIFDSIKDHNGEEILTQKGNIEIYTIFGNKTKKWFKNQEKFKKLWKIKK